MSILYRGPSIDASYHVSVHLTEGVSEKIKMGKVNGRQTTDTKWWQKLTLPLARWAKNTIDEGTKMFWKYQLAVWLSIQNSYSHFTKVTRKCKCFGRIVEPWKALTGKLVAIIYNKHHFQHYLLLGVWMGNLLESVLLEKILLPDMDCLAAKQNSFYYYFSCWCCKI